MDEREESALSLAILFAVNVVLILAFQAAN